MAFKAPSPAMAVSLVALAVALGGTGYAITALPNDSVGTKQIKKSAVTSAKVKDGTLAIADFSPTARAALTGAAGATGSAGAVGATGETGARGVAGPTAAASSSVSASGVQLTASYQDILTTAGAPGLAASPLVTTAAGTVLVQAVVQFYKGTLQTGSIGDVECMLRMSNGGAYQQIGQVSEVTAVNSSVASTANWITVPVMAMAPVEVGTYTFRASCRNTTMAYATAALTTQSGTITAIAVGS